VRPMSDTQHLAAVVLLPLDGSAVAARLQQRFELVGCATLPVSAISKYVKSTPPSGKCLATAWEVTSPTVLEAMKLVLGNGDGTPGSVVGSFGGSAAVGPIVDATLSAAVCGGAHLPSAASPEAPPSKSVPSEAKTSNPKKGHAATPASATRAAAGPPLPPPASQVQRHHLAQAKPLAVPLVQLTISRKDRGVALAISRCADRVAVSVRRPTKGQSDWLTLCRLAPAAASVAKSDPASRINAPTGEPAKATTAPRGTSAEAPIAADPAPQGPVIPHFRSTAQRAAMQECLFHSPSRKEQPYLYHAGRVPWYAALRAGSAF